jgi:hypothetical protein
MTPQKTPKQKGLFMGFPGTFARLKSRLRQMAENQVGYGSNGPGNQAPGRSATMVTRTVSRGGTALNSDLFWYFWLTIQNTADRQVRNQLFLLAVFISFAGAQCELRRG